MRYCDITFAYSESSGGIKTYIDSKRRYLREHTDDEHVLVVPGEADRVERDGRLLKVVIDSPPAPWHTSYHLLWRVDKIEAAFAAHRPDCIELASFFVSPGAAFRHRRDRRQRGERCVVGAYFHTDIAEAYIGGPLATLFREHVARWSESLAGVGEAIRQAAENQATRYFGHIFQSCDLVLAAGDAQIERLREYGVERAHPLPLGVDTGIFRPEARSDAVRTRFGADPESLVLFYGGRMDSEKRVDLLVDAFERLERSDAILVLMGEGPLKPELLERAESLSGLRVLPYEKDREQYAAALASADLYVTAGPHETFGLSVVEAQACGLPVVGVRAGALPQRVTEEVGLLGPPGDAEAMARNIEEAARRRETMAPRARARVLESGSGWRATFEKMAALYREQLARPGREE